MLAGQEEDVTISAVLKFRKALFFIQKEYPFSYSFGPASSREECIGSAQSVYERLLLHKHPERDYLHFETIALLALDSKGRLDTDKARRLIKVRGSDDFYMRRAHLLLTNYCLSSCSSCSDLTGMVD